MNNKSKAQEERERQIRSDRINQANTRLSSRPTKAKSTGPRGPGEHIVGIRLLGEWHDVSSWTEAATKVLQIATQKILSDPEIDLELRRKISKIYIPQLLGKFHFKETGIETYVDRCFAFEGKQFSYPNYMSSQQGKAMINGILDHCLINPETELEYHTR